MTKVGRLLQKAVRAPASLRFREARALAEAVGFRLARVSGSYHIYAHPDIPELVNLQEVRGEAKAYQVRQLLALIERYNLSIERRMRDYHINIFWSDEDEGYVADIPDLEACSAVGTTPAEALAEVVRAKDAWLLAARAEGKPIPAPRYRPARYQPA